MNQPLLPQRVGNADLDDMFAGSDRVLDLESILEDMFGGKADEFDPDDAVAIELWRMFNIPATRAVLEWLFDLTRRAPFPNEGGSFETVALAAERYRARQRLGAAIAGAIVRGQKLDSPPQKENRDENA